jgi:hypothetical protein
LCKMIVRGLSAQSGDPTEIGRDWPVKRRSGKLADWPGTASLVLQR